MFGDDNFGEWCATQNKQVNCTFAAVAASRVLPNISGGHAVDVRNATKGLIFDISIIRAILTVAVCGAKEIATLATAAKSASSFTLKYVQQTDTGNFAHSAAVMAASLVLEERDFSTAQVLRLASQSMSKTTQNSALASGLIAANYDANALTAEFLSLYKVETIWKRGLWLDAGIPTQVQSNWFNLKRKWSSHLAMTFWIDWYEGLLVGSAHDWDLWHDIVLIDDEHWKAGPEAVAREIERIKMELRDKRTSDEERAPEFEPPSVAPLQQNGFLVRAAALSMSGQIESAIDTYLNETGQNCLPATFAPLHGISHASFQIAGLVDLPKPSDEETQRLREEVGRLKAHIAQLEKELASALAAKEAVFIPELKKKIAQSIGDWKLYGAIFGSVWLISGDELGMQKRLENLGKTRDAFFQDVDEPPKTPEPPTITFDV
jgi:hypothetical protein